MTSYWIILLVLFESKVEYQSQSSQLSILNLQMLMIRHANTNQEEFCTLLSAMANRLDGFLDVETLMAVQYWEPDIRWDGGSSNTLTLGVTAVHACACQHQISSSWGGCSSLWTSDAEWCMHAYHINTNYRKRYINIDWLYIFIKEKIYIMYPTPSWLCFDLCTTENFPFFPQECPAIIFETFFCVVFFN